jgi:hypothetical protein
MFYILQNTHRKGWLRSLATMACACASAASQDFAFEVDNSNPLRIGSFVPSGLELPMDAGVEGGMKGAFSYGLGVQTTYNSNFTLLEDNEESEVTVAIAPWLGYVSDPEGGAFFSLAANYYPAYNVYLENSESNQFDQSGDLVMTFTGSRTEVSLFGRYAELSGTDRITGNFTTGTVYSVGVRANRQIATRTSLYGGLTYSESDYSSGGNRGSQNTTANFGGLWRASERTSVGSSIRYSRSESDNTGTRDAWALLAELRYKAGERIWLSASLGPEFTSDSRSGDNSVGVRAEIDARYVINERWTWKNSLGTATIPSPNDVGYVVNNLNFTSQLSHQLVRATLSGGFSFDYTEYESVGAVVRPREDEQNYSLFLAYSRNLFSERVSFDTTVRYRMNEGNRDWSQWLVSMGLSAPF